MKILVASNSEISLALMDKLKGMGHQTDLSDCCDTMAGDSYGMVIYDAMPCLENRHDDDNYSHLSDFSDVVVGAYRLTTDHSHALHVLISSDESLYRDGGFYGRNRKLVEEVYYLCRLYLVVRCPEILGNCSNDLLETVIDNRPFPYTPDTTLQFVGVESVVNLVCACAFKVDTPTVLVAAGSGCVIAHELALMAGHAGLSVSDHARKISRDCDASLVDRMVGLKSSRDYAQEYISRRLNPDIMSGSVSG